jgi:hypothetical protein
MSRVEQIEAAIASLEPEEFRRIARWIVELDQKQWDEQLDRDSSSGKLDALFREAEEESASGQLREWPPAE